MQMVLLAVQAEVVTVVLLPIKVVERLVIQVHIHQQKVLLVVMGKVVILDKQAVVVVLLLLAQLELQVAQVEQVQRHQLLEHL
jgi:hypothetical protein